MLKDPPHPGETLREDVLGPLNLRVREASVFLNFSQATLVRVLNGRDRITAELAVKLEKAGFSTARFWMMLQLNYDLAQAAKQHLTVRRIA